MTPLIGVPGPTLDPLLTPPVWEVEPFSVSFSPEEACEEMARESALEELPASFTATLGDYSQWSAWKLRTALEPLLQEVSAAEESTSPQGEKLTSALEEALSVLRRCDDFCCCGADLWESVEEWYDDLLNSLPDTLWAVSSLHHRVDEFLDDLSIGFTVSELFALLGTRNGWDSVSLAWDGTSLDASFKVSGGGSGSLRLRPLTKEQCEVQEYWCEADPYLDAHASRVLDHNWESLLFTQKLHEEVSLENEGAWEFTEMVESLATCGFTALDEVHKELLLPLRENWEGTFLELLEAVKLLHPQEAAVAA